VADACKYDFSRFFSNPFSSSKPVTVTALLFLNVHVRIPLRSYLFETDRRTGRHDRTCPVFFPFVPFPLWAVLVLSLFLFPFLIINRTIVAFLVILLYSFSLTSRRHVSWSFNVLSWLYSARSQFVPLYLDLLLAAARQSAMPSSSQSPAVFCLALFYCILLFSVLFHNWMCSGMRDEVDSKWNDVLDGNLKWHT
jgi:hypothetical protein